MIDDLEKLYEVYSQIKIENPKFDSKIRKGQIVTVIYEDEKYPAVWETFALYDSSPNRYGKERVMYTYQGIIGNAEWDGERWFSNWGMCMH